MHVGSCSKCTCPSPAGGCCSGLKLPERIATRKTAACPPQTLQHPCLRVAEACALHGAICATSAMPAMLPPPQEARGQAVKSTCGCQGSFVLMRGSGTVRVLPVGRECPMGETAAKYWISDYGTSYTYTATASTFQGKCQVHFISLCDLAWLLHWVLACIV